MKKLRLYCSGTALGILIGLSSPALHAQVSKPAPTPASQSQADNSTEQRNSSVVLPDGTEIVVRTNEAIDSSTATPDKTFSANVEQDVTGSTGQVLIPKGSSADLVVRKVSAGGTTGSPQLALDLQALNIGGHRYVVSTSDLEQSNNQGIGKNRRTGEYVGGGAAVGTLLGAIAGGGKGAVIGAVAGAAAGGTAQVLTKGKEVKVPAETTLKFRLDRPLRLQSSGD